MAKNNQKNVANSKTIKNTQNIISNLMGQLSMTMYGTDRKSDVSDLDKIFQDIMDEEMKNLKSSSKNNGVSSFLSELSSKNAKDQSIDAILDSQLSGYGGNYSTMTGFIQQAYRNRKLQQSDTHQVASQLIELNEAILITRDAMISPDSVEGRMQRDIIIDNFDNDEQREDIMPVIEAVEEKYDIQNKIKNFIIPNELEYGEYYVYVIPYSKIFNDFVRFRNNYNTYHEGADTKNGNAMEEINLLDYVTESENIAHHNLGKINGNPIKKKQTFAENLYTTYKESCEANDQKMDIEKSEFVKDIEGILSNITVSNEAVPIPVLEDGFESMTEFCESFVNEAGDALVTEKKVTVGNHSSFDDVMRNVDGGVHIQNKKGTKMDDFKDIKDCYIKMIDPTVMIPIELMNQTIGYYYVTSEDIVPTGGHLGTNIYTNPFEPGRSERTIIDAIAEKIVNSFDKKFLKDNLKFKETIVEAITYYNINEKKIKFQYIPVEYVVPFKIDQDENGHGQSMIKKSLFYAKLYLMLLIFKIMTIITNSNDTKVSYIKQSGIDKNISNKIQQIAREKQARRINVVDLFNYTSLINKVGSGNEMIVPMGRSNERAIETEILAGQDVQLNTDLMEMLKNAYILGTGVPAAIVNYLSEADFAKVVEQNNTKFHGRVVNYQLDTNAGCTELYRKILRYSTNLDDSIIESIKFVLPPPKTVTNQVKADAVSGFGTLADFFVGLKIPQEDQSNPNTQKVIEIFKQKLAREFIPGIDFDRIDELFDKSKLDAVEKEVEPNPANGEDDAADMGIDDLGI